MSQSTGKAEAGASIPVGAGDDYTRYLEAGSMADYARQYNIENIPFVAETDAESGLYRLLVAAGGRQVDGRASADRADDA